MLRRVAFQNFMLFRDHQSLELQDGPNFFIGAYGTGKSGTTELIRRCLSGTVSVSTPNVLDKSYPAFTVCKFEITTQLSQEVPADCMLYSLLVAIHTNGRKNIYKMVSVERSNPVVVSSYLDIHSYPETSSANIPQETKSYVYENEGQETVITKIKQILDKKNENAPKDFLHLLLDIESKSDAKDGLVRETILEAVTAVFICTFPIRSPVPNEWSQGNLVKPEHGAENNAMANEKCEIIKQLLSLTDDKLDKKKAKEIFDTIIYPLKYTVGIDSDSNIKATDCEGRDTPLLKNLESLIEVELFALILAHKKYQTICLEEPDRGMHPPMIQKMRDLVLRKHRHQVIILTSHSPAMTSYWTFERVFVFRRKLDNNGKVRQSIYKLDIKNTYKKFNHHQDMLKQLLYSSSVLFVEGQTDKMVIDMLFNKILSDSYADVRCEEFKDLRQIVSETQIVAIDGSKTYSLWKKMTEEIEVPYAFLFDKDSVFECKEEISLKEKNQKWKENALLCVKALLGKVEMETSTPIEQKYSGQPEQENTKTIQKQLKFLKRKIETGETVKDFLQITDQELTSNTLPFHKIENFMNKIVLPKKFVKVKDHVEKVYGIQVKDEDLRPFHDIRIHLWKSGNLEDMICTCILDGENQTDKKVELMRDIFTCEEYYEQPTNPKNPIKETLKQMDYEKAEKIAECLWKNPEISNFFDFLRRLQTVEVLYDRSRYEK